MKFWNPLVIQFYGNNGEVFVIAPATSVDPRPLDIVLIDELCWSLPNFVYGEFSKRLCEFNEDQIQLQDPRPTLTTNNFWEFQIICEIYFGH